MTAEEPAPSAQDGFEAFAALAAHQLGEAVALMRGAAAVLEGQQSALGPGGQDALRALSAGGDRAQRFVDDLLDVVRAGGEPVGDAVAELDPAFDAATAQLEGFLHRVPVHVQREPLPRAAIEGGDARRVFSHLLRSALAAGATRVGVTGRVEGAEVVVELFDNGAPAPEGTNPFAPLARPRGRGLLVGAGVSLPVVRRLVTRSDGRIAMAVRSDGATIITVELPVPR
ncbi:MAG TPA: HAMP domain-containing sensor histidine kinase [Baekduia sp.]|nr:HAMP domain-containing sensor histidine kinase [Baekduia sp.]